MEPMVFFVFAMLFWGFTFMFLVVGLLAHALRMKGLRKVMLILALTVFSVPWLILAGTRIAEQFSIMELTGHYSGLDANGNHVQMDISGSGNQFSVEVEEYPNIKITGSWDFISEYDAAWYYPDDSTAEVSFNKVEDKHYLEVKYPDAEYCCQLSEVVMVKE